MITNVYICANGDNFSKSGNKILDYCVTSVIFFTYIVMNHMFLKLFYSHNKTIYNAILKAFTTYDSRVVILFLF